MKKYEDIHSYYPSYVQNKDISFDDFIIIDMNQAVAHQKDDDEFLKYSGPHLRDFFEICIGVNEPYTSYFNVGSEVFKSKNEHILFVSPIQPFSFTFNKQKRNKNSKGYIIAFKPSFLISKKRSYEILNTYRYFSSYSFPQHVLKPELLKPLLDLAIKMYDEYTHPQEYAKEIIGGYMEVLLNLLNRFLKMENEIIASNTCEHIAINFERRIIDDGNKISSVTHYASSLNISTSYLSDCVKKATGRSAKQIINNHKLIIAKSLLQQKEKSIAEIAFEMEFSEPTNFTKFFKQLAGITPNQFRR
jgi:AraC-like DNA-binding protein